MEEDFSLPTPAGAEGRTILASNLYMNTIGCSIRSVPLLKGTCQIFSPLGLADKPDDGPDQAAYNSKATKYHLAIESNIVLEIEKKRYDEDEPQ